LQLHRLKPLLLDVRWRKSTKLPSPRGFNEVDSRIMARKRGEVKSRVISNMVMEKLKELDEVAYIRFASVYLPLGDLDAMKREVWIGCWSRSRV
jgi:hypothetical protein